MTIWDYILWIGRRIALIFFIVLGIQIAADLLKKDLCIPIICGVSKFLFALFGIARPV